MAKKKDFLKICRIRIKDIREMTKFSNRAGKYEINEMGCASN